MRRPLFSALQCGRTGPLVLVVAKEGIAEVTNHSSVGVEGCSHPIFEFEFWKEMFVSTLILYQH